MLVYKKFVLSFLGQESYGFTIPQKFDFFDGNAVASNWLKIEYSLVGAMGIDD